MIFGRRRPEAAPEPDWDDPMWVPQPVERWIEPEEVAERLRRRRSRWRALRHSVVLLLVIAVVGGGGIIAGGAVLGRWELPWSPTPRSAGQPTAEPTGDPLDCARAVVVPAGIQGTSVVVLNATSTSGLAGNVGDELERRGFTVVEVGNSRADVPESSLVQFPEGAEAAALAVAAHLNVTELRSEPDVEVVTVLLGDAWSEMRAPEDAAVVAAEPKPSVVTCAEGAAPSAPAPAPSG